jgi:hypothetical protein
MSDQKLSFSLDSIIIASDAQVSAHFDDSVVILGMKSGAYFSLDEVGLFIWNLLQEPRRVSDIRDAIFDEYEVELSQCEQDLFAVLMELAEKQLIDVRSGLIA